MESDLSLNINNKAVLFDNDLEQQYPTEETIQDNLIRKIFYIGKNKEFIGYILSKDKIPTLLYLLSNPLTKLSNIKFILNSLYSFYKQFPSFIPFFNDITIKEKEKEKIYDKIEENSQVKSKKESLNSINADNWRYNDGPENLNKILIKKYLLYLFEESNDIKEIRNLIIDLLKLIVFNVNLQREFYELALNFIAVRMRKEESDTDINNEIFYNYLTLLHVLYGSYNSTMIKKEPKNYIYHQGNSIITIKPKEMINTKNGMVFHIWFYIVENGPLLKGIFKVKTTLINFKFCKTNGKEEENQNETDITISLNETYDYITLSNDNRKYIGTTGNRVIKIERKTWYHLCISLENKSDELNALITIDGDKLNDFTSILSKIPISFNEIKSINAFENFYGLSSSIIFLPVNESNNEEEQFNVKYGYYSRKLMHKLMNYYDIKNFECYSPLYYYKDERTFDNLKNQNEARIICTNDKKDFYCNVHRYNNVTKHIENIGGINNLLPIFEYMFTHQENFVSEEVFEFYIELIQKIVMQSKYNMKDASSNGFFRSFGLLLSNFSSKYFRFSIVTYLTQIGNSGSLNPFSEIRNSYTPSQKEEQKKKKNVFEKKNLDFLVYVLSNPKVFIHFSLYSQTFLSNSILNLTNSLDALPDKINFLFIKTFILKFEKLRGNQFCCCKHSIRMYHRKSLNGTNIKFDIMYRGILNYFNTMKNILLYFFVKDAIREIDEPLNSLFIFKLFALNLSPCSIKFILSSYNNLFSFANKYERWGIISLIDIRDKQGEILLKLLKENFFDYFLYIIITSSIDVRKAALELLKKLVTEYNHYIRNYFNNDEIEYLNFIHRIEKILGNHLLHVNYQFKLPYQTCGFDKIPIQNRKLKLNVPILKKRGNSFTKSNYKNKFDENYKNEFEIQKTKPNNDLDVSDIKDIQSLLIKINPENSLDSIESASLMLSPKNFKNYSNNKIKWFNSIVNYPPAKVYQEAKDAEIKYLHGSLLEEKGSKILTILYGIIDETRNKQQKIANIFFKIFAKLLSESRNLELINSGLILILNFVQKDKKDRIVKEDLSNNHNDEIFYETSFFYHFIIEIMFHVTMLGKNENFYSSLKDFFSFNKDTFNNRLSIIYSIGINLFLSIFFVDKEMFNKYIYKKKKNSQNSEHNYTMLPMNNHINTFSTWAIYQKCIFDSFQEKKDNMNILLEFIKEHFQRIFSEYKKYKIFPLSIEDNVWLNFITSANLLYEYILCFDKAYEIVENGKDIIKEINETPKFIVPIFYNSFWEEGNRTNKENLYFIFYSFIYSKWTPKDYFNILEEEKIKILKDKLKNIDTKKITDDFRIFQFFTFAYETNDDMQKIVPLCKIIATMYNILLSLHINDDLNYTDSTGKLIEEYQLFINYFLIISTNLVYNNIKINTMQNEFRYIKQILTYGIYFFIEESLKENGLYLKVIRSSLTKITITLVKIFTTFKLKKILLSPIYEIFTKYISKCGEHETSPFIQWAQRQNIDNNKEFVNYYYREKPFYSKLKEDKNITDLLSDYFDVKIFDNIKQRFKDISNIIPYFSCVDKNTKIVDDREKNKIVKYDIQAQIVSNDKDYIKKFKILKEQMNKHLEEFKALQRKEENINEKMLIKQIKGYYKTKINLFSWRGLWSNKYFFYNKPNLIKKTLINHYTKEFSMPLMKPILDIEYYLPSFRRFNINNLFKNKEYEQYQIPLNIRKILNTYNNEIYSNDSSIELKLHYIFEEIYKNKQQHPKLPKKPSRNYKINDKSVMGYIIISEAASQLAPPENNNIIPELTEEMEKDNKSEISLNERNQNNSRLSKLEDDKNKNDTFISKNSKKAKPFINTINIDDKNNVLLKFKCCLVKQSHHIRGYFSLEKKKIRFSPEMYSVNLQDIDYDKDNHTCFGSLFQNHKKIQDMKELKIHYFSILYYFYRRYYLRETGIEFFTVDNKSYYFNFKTKEQRNIVIKTLEDKFNKKIVKIDRETNPSEIGACCYNAFKFPKIQFQGKLKKIREKWKQWEMSTFEFLMWCNLFGGRSYKDISAYPVFPWPIDFTYYNELTLNISSKKSRIETYNKEEENLGKLALEQSKEKKEIDTIHPERNIRQYGCPMGMMEVTEEGKIRARNYREEYENLKDEIEEEEESEDESALFHNQKEAYVYGSHYSNPMYVGYYLCKTFPFAQIKIEMQGDKFDAPTRMFLSIERSFKGAVSTKCDLRELTPELFYLREIYFNENKLEMGEKVEDIQLPQWANNNIYVLIKKMRKALDYQKSDDNNYIGQWIDLIFGFKQRGEQGKKVFNIFMDYSYENNVHVDSLSKTDGQDYLRMVELGLTPGQIFLNEIGQRGMKPSQITKTNKLKNTKEKAINHKEQRPILISYIEPKQNEENGTLLILYSNFKLIARKNNSTFKQIEIELTQSQSKELYNIQRKMGMLAEKNHYPLCTFVNKSFFKVAYGGFWDGEILIIAYELEEKKLYQYEICEKSNKSPILCIAVDTNEVYAAAGNSKGCVLIYSISKIVNWNIKLKLCNHSADVTNVVINNELRVLASASKDKFINLYTMPRFQYFQSVKVSFTPNKLFVSSVPIPCFVIYNKLRKEYKSFHINGKEIQISKKNRIIKEENDEKEEMVNQMNYGNYSENSKGIILNKITEIKGDIGRIKCALTFIDNSFNEFLVLGMSNGVLKIRRFPDMKVVSEFEMGDKSIKTMYIRKDGQAIYFLSDKNLFYTVEDYYFAKSIFKENMIEMFS